MKRTILFTGGGTAGHVFPGLAVARELQKTIDADIVWVGSKHGMEKKFVEAEGLIFTGIPAGKMRRYLSLQNVVDIFKIIAGIVKCFGIIGKYKPELVFSKGGYVSVPLVVAAGRRGIPVITHESDTDPGLATKLNARYAVTICVAFERTKEYFDSTMRKKIAVTGNPVREEISGGSRERGIEMLKVPPGRKVIFVLGGSQGAAQINKLIGEILPSLQENYFVLHQMGLKQYRPSDHPLYRTFGFIGTEMPDFLAAADLVVCRAGANTLAEISLLGKPAVLIPLMGGAGRGDQVKNARLFLENNAAAVLEGEEASPERLLRTITGILEDPEKERTLSRNIRRLAHLDAAALVVREIHSVLDPGV